jgi:transposase
VASGATEHDAEVISLGTMGTRQAASDQRMRTMPSKANQLVLVYDAGPCGSWLSRYLTQTGPGCWVVAPSLLPNKAGDRVQTARRAARQRARLRRSGDLSPVDVPTVADAAIRALTCAREEALRARKTAKCRLKACLLRHAIRSTGRAAWGPAPRRWRAEVGCPPPAPQLVLQDYVRTVNAHTARLQRLAPARQDHVKPWRLPPVVEALQAWRDVQCTVAVTLVADLGDLPRVATPRPLLTYLGLIPSAYASGERRRQGR